MPQSASSDAINGTKKISHPNTAAAPTGSSITPSSFPIGIANRTAIAAVFNTISTNRS
jgi:hypothetical protein